MTTTDIIKHVRDDRGSLSDEVEVCVNVHKIPVTLKVVIFRPELISGATFMLLAPEHPSVHVCTNVEQKQAVAAFTQAVQAISSSKRNEANYAVEGVFTGTHALNPVTGEKIPIWITSFGSMNDGTGALLAVPAHDEQAFRCAKRFGLPIRQVVAPEMGIKRENETFADGGCSVVFSPVRGQYAFGRLENGKTIFFAGGLQDGETVKMAILRELAEESGLTDIAQSETIAVAYGHYYNSLKKVNRLARATCLLVILHSDTSIGTKLEAHEKIEVIWQGAAETLAAWQQDPDKGYDHYSFFLKQAVARAIELGFDTVSDPTLFRACAFEGEGIIINSGIYDGLSTGEARNKIIADLVSKGIVVDRSNAMEHLSKITDGFK